MLLPPDDNILKNGFCWGKYDPKLDDESRLRFPKEVLGILTEHKVTELYRCPDPAGVGFILCPPGNWKMFFQTVKKHFAKSSEAERAFRLLCSGLPASIDSQGRIRITKACMDHAKVGPGNRVNMLGVGKWFEISVYNNGTEAKELVFKESKILQNTPSGTKI
ncbi:MAG: hypothetical protein ABSB11_05480 [Sedimentisphaerales bacterium]|jgi:DNA-binding transcriptional regulator/RsmH inhibitor MraZ